MMPEEGTGTFFLLFLLFLFFSAKESSYAVVNKLWTNYGHMVNKNGGQVEVDNPDKLEKQ
jgi:hypothetical protein